MIGTDTADSDADAGAAADGPDANADTHSDSLDTVPHEDSDTDTAADSVTNTAADPARDTDAAEVAKTDQASESREAADTDDHTDTAGANGSSAVAPSPRGRPTSMPPRPELTTIAPGPPPRPELSFETPAPVLAEVPRTKPIAISRLLWLLSFGVGTAAVLFAMFSSGARRLALENAMTPLAPDQDAATITALATLAFWGALISLVLVTLVELLLVTLMLRGRSAMRWWLIPIVVVAHVAAGIFADAFVAVDEGGLLVSILLAAQWLLAAIATTAALLPGASDWFHAKREARAHAIP